MSEREKAERDGGAALPGCRAGSPRGRSRGADRGGAARAALLRSASRSDAADRTARGRGGGRPLLWPRASGAAARFPRAARERGAGVAPRFALFLLRGQELRPAPGGRRARRGVPRVGARPRGRAGSSAERSSKTGERLGAPAPARRPPSRPRKRSAATSSSRPLLDDALAVARGTLQGGHPRRPSRAAASRDELERAWQAALLEQPGLGKPTIPAMRSPSSCRTIRPYGRCLPSSPRT